MADTADTPIKIKASDVSVFYGDKQALKSVSVDIPANTVTAFIGPSGCGKSTFLRCFNRMNDVIAGARVEGSIMMDDGSEQPGYRSGTAAGAGRHGLPEAEPVSEIDF